MFAVAGTYPAVFVAVIPPDAGAVPREAHTAPVKLVVLAACLVELDQLRRTAVFGKVLRFGVLLPVADKLLYKAIDVIQGVQHLCHLLAVRPQRAVRLCVSAFLLSDVKLYYRSEIAVQTKRERVTAMRVICKNSQKLHLDFLHPSC